MMNNIHNSKCTLLALTFYAIVSAAYTIFGSVVVSSHNYSYYAIVLLVLGTSTLIFNMTFIIAIPIRGESNVNSGIFTICGIILLLSPFLLVSGSMVYIIIYTGEVIQGSFTGSLLEYYAAAGVVGLVFGTMFLIMGLLAACGIVLLPCGIIYETYKRFYPDPIGIVSTV